VALAFAYRLDDKLTFIHASSIEGKVVIDEKTLADYCDSQESCTGIMVVKIND
jgi:hypothetical protein